jgi:hypothetical protein
MNIIELAREAGFGIDEAPIDQPYVIQPLHGKIDDELRRFAHLVRQQALEEAAQECENQKVGLSSYFEIDERIGWCADAIRALKGEAE